MTKRTCAEAGLEVADVLNAAGAEIAMKSPAMAERLHERATAQERALVRAERFG